MASLLDVPYVWHDLPADLIDKPLGGIFWTSIHLAMHAFVAEKGDYHEIRHGLQQNLLRENNCFKWSASFAVSSNTDLTFDTGSSLYSFPNKSGAVCCSVPITSSIVRCSTSPAMGFRNTG